MKKNRTTSLLAAVIFCLMALAPTQSFTVSANEVVTETQIEDVYTVPESEYKVAISYMDILNVYYKKLADICAENNVEMDKNLTLQVFHDAYYSQTTYLISDYMDYLENIIVMKSQNNDCLAVSDLNVNFCIMLLNNEVNWWENIGESGNLPQKPNYENFLYELKKGDIIYEQGADIGILETGHIAIVEDKFTGTSPDNNNDGVNEVFEYWRVIESTLESEGVVYSVIDNNRFIAQRSIVLRVDAATELQCENAVDFCVEQIGDGYLALSILPILAKPNVTQDSWMCSTLIWFAYKEQGIDICPNTLTTLPIDIYNSSATSVVSFIEYSHLRFRIIGKIPFMFFYYSWDVRIYNPNNFNINGLYNSRMCYDTHALTFDEVNLDHETPFILNKHMESVSYIIEHNGTATHITMCYKIALGDTRYKVVTAANNIDVASCTMYYNLIMYEEGE